MVMVRRIGWGVLICGLGAAAYGQRPAPLADRPDQPLMPFGITEHSVTLNGELAYLFKDEDGTDAVHVIGAARITLGPGPEQELRSREAVIWLMTREYQGRPYRHLQILLWRGAEVIEIGHTITSGPVLLVTLNSFGDVVTRADEVAFQSSADSQVYREGNAIRRAVAAGVLRELDEDVSLRVFDASGLGPEERRVRRRPPILLDTPGIMTTEVLGDRRVITVVGGAYLSRGDSDSGDFLEIRADSVVVFLPVSEESLAGGGRAAASVGSPGGEAADQAARQAGTARLWERRRSADQRLRSPGLGDEVVEGVYLEGDVVMSQGANMIRASRLYYDFLKEKALILDAVIRSTLAGRNVPLYVRAEEIRQLTAKQFVASQAILTTDEFHTPHYHVGAGRVELTDRTPADPRGRRTDVRAGSFKIHDATLNLSGYPIGYWPYLQGRIDTSETGVSSVRTGYSDDFGVEIETDWHLFNVLGLETPEGFQATLSLDFYSERGPAVGVDAEYEQDRYFGLIKSYLLFDADVDFLGRERETPTRRDVRGRFLLRHRQYLEDDWQLSLELSYICDEGFLEEFFESEFDNDKDQETLLHLKKQRDTWAFVAHLQSRLMDFTTQTERLPEFAYYRVGEPFGDRATWFSENRAGMVRYRPANQTFPELLRVGRARASGAVIRADSRQEIDAPIDAGPVRLVPFVSVRGTMWDDSPDRGGIIRAFGVAGLRGSLYLNRTFPEQRSSLFDIDGVRHIIKPDLTAWVSGTNREADDLFPFDDRVESINEVDGVALGLRQRWQTKRGRDANRRIVDFVTLDVEVGFFNGAAGDTITNGYTPFDRPEASIARNYVNSSLIWRVNDRTALLSELNYDLNDGEIDLFNLSLAVERPPRFSYLLGYRYIEEGNSNLLGFDMNYRLTEKYTMAVREAFDLARGTTLDLTLAIIRKFPRWFGAVSFELDEAENDFGVSFSLWPEGLPRAALGSRRFTGLANTTRIREN